MERGVVVERVRLVMVVGFLMADGKAGRNSDGRRNGRRMKGGMVGGER